MISFPSICFSVGIKSLWLITFVSMQTHETLPTAKGLTVMSKVSLTSTILTTIFIFLLSCLDVMTIFAPHCRWIGFGLFSLTTLWCGHYALMSVLLMPPTLDFLNRIWDRIEESTKIIGTTPNSPRKAKLREVVGLSLDRLERLEGRMDLIDGGIRRVRFEQ